MAKPIVAGLRGLLRLAAVRTAGDLAAGRSRIRPRKLRQGARRRHRTSAWSSSAIRSWVHRGRLALRRFPDEPEGSLHLRKAAIVNDARLAETARRLGFAGALALTTGMRNAGGADNTTVLAGAFEAFVAALHLTYGLERARHFVVTQHIEPLDHCARSLIDPKTRLQNYAQEHLAATPVYRDEKAGGTPGEPLLLRS